MNTSKHTISNGSFLSFLFFRFFLPVLCSVTALQVLVMQRRVLLHPEGSPAHTGPLHSHIESQDVALRWPGVHWARVPWGWQQPSVMDECSGLG